MVIQYLVRTYSLRVVEAGREEREFTLSVPSQSLLDNRFKCQDAPALCLAKLKEAQSSETPEHTVPLQMTVSEAELRKYVETLSPTLSTSLFPMDQAIQRFFGHLHSCDLSPSTR